MHHPQLALLTRQLALAFDRRSWHGPNLMGSLRGVSMEAASWRPQPGRHNIWEVVVHCAYWKYRVCRLVSSDAPRSFSLKGSDWFPRPDTASNDALEQDLALLRAWHEILMEVTGQLDSVRLQEPVGSGEFTVAELLSGIVAHDVYHAGQIRLLRRMQDAEAAK